MAGLAKTTRFMIGAATLMLGSQSSLYNLKPSTNSIGLVKNVTMSSDPVFTNLTQGPTNSLVYSMLTGNPVKISAEVFEYTAQNLAYGLCLDGTGIAAQTITTTTTAIIDGSPTPTGNVTVASSAGMVAGTTYIMIDASGGTADDDIIVRKVLTVTDGTHIVVTPLIAVDVASGAVVTVVNAVDVGSTAANSNPFLSAKVVGQLADGTSAVILFPKVRVTKGFTMAFNAEQYGNLPFEIEVYDLVPADTFYSDFPNSKSRLFTK